MIKFILWFSVFSILSGCFKFEPKHEIQRLAGSWEIQKAEITYYSVSGADSSKNEVTDLGYLHLYFTDDFLYENSYSQTISPGYLSLNNSMIKDILTQSNVWWVSKDSKNMGFGFKDYQTGYVTTISMITLDKKSKNKYNVTAFSRYSNGNLKSYEIWKLKRD